MASQSQHGEQDSNLLLLASDSSRSSPLLQHAGTRITAIYVLSTLARYPLACDILCLDCFITLAIVPLWQHLASSGSADMTRRCLHSCGRSGLFQGKVQETQTPGSYLGNTHSR
jgi:hypothetical protein